MGNTPKSAAEKAADKAAKAAAKKEYNAAKAKAAGKGTEPQIPETTTAAASEPQEPQTPETEPQTEQTPQTENAAGSAAESAKLCLKLQFNDQSKLQFFFNSDADITTVVQEISSAIITAYEFSNLRMPNGKRSCTKRQILSGSRFKLSYWRESHEVKTLFSDSTHTNKALQFDAWLQKVIGLILNTQRAATIAITR